MPVYEFQCQDCQNAFRERRPFDQAGAGAICPVCHSEHTKKLLNVVAVIGGSQTQRQPAGSIPLDMGSGSGCGCGACSCGS